MENVGNDDSESNFKKTEKAIRRAYLSISQEQSGVHEKINAVKLMEKKCINLEDELSKYETNYSKMNESLRREIERFKVSVPHQIRCIDNNKNELEIQLQHLENGKNILVDQANRLTNDYQNIQMNIRKVSNLDKSIKFGAKTINSEFDEAQHDQIKQESHQLIDNIGLIVQQINESKKTLLQYDAAAVQMHTFVLQELGLSFKLQKQIFQHQFFLSNSLDNLKSTILGEKRKQIFASQDYEKIKDELHFLSQLMELKTHNVIRNDAKLKKILAQISFIKTEILKKGSQIQELKNKIQRQKEKKQAYREKTELFIDLKKRQINKIHHSIYKIKNLTSDQMKEVSTLYLKMRSCKSTLISIKNNIEEERQKEISLENLSNQIELLELKKGNEIKMAEKILQKNRHVFNDISKKVLEQKNVAYQLEIKKIDGANQETIVDPPQIDFSKVTNEINEAIKVIEELKEQIIKQLKVKKFFLKQKSELLSEFSEATKNSLNLERCVKEFKENIYYQKSMNAHNDLLIDQTISTDIDNKIIENEKKKIMIQKKKKCYLEL